MSVKVHEAFCFDSFQDRLLFFDDFHGDQLQDEWRTAGAGGSDGVVDQQTGGVVRLTTGATTGNIRYLDWANFRSLHVTKRVSFEARVKASADTYIQMYIGLRFDADNQITFYLDEVDGTPDNWQLLCEDNNVITNPLSGVAQDAAYHIFRIECHIHDGSHVHFYIDGIECDNSPVNTNIPDDAADFLQPFFRVSTAEDVAKSMDVDYCYLRQDR